MILTRVTRNDTYAGHTTLEVETCPVDGCKRHFKDLRRHISTKHPDYHGQPQA